MSSVFSHLLVRADHDFSSPFIYSAAMTSVTIIISKVHVGDMKGLAAT